MWEDLTRPDATLRRALMQALALHRWRIRQDRRCRQCGALMPASTLARKFCGVRCRVAYHRARKAAPTLEQICGRAR
jgi:hypothetical protein